MDGCDVIVHEALTCDIQYLLFRVLIDHCVSYSMKKMGLSKSNSSIDEEGVPIFPRILCNIFSGSCGEIIRISHQELFKHIL